MTVTLDGQEIPSGGTGEGGGAVFTLTEPATVGAEFVASSGERAVVSSGSQGLVVSGLAASDYPAAWRQGLIVAQQALDVSSARGLADLHLREPQFQHVAVYGDGGGQVLRFVAVSTINFGMTATLEVRNESGAVVPPSPPIANWHESMRYYRQSQLSDDLFESFRSLWLAIENLLDSLEPADPSEREKEWLKRALGKADSAVELKHFLPTGFAGTAVNAAYKYFYDETRTHLFHAKASRKPLLPYEEVGTNLLASRHQHLTRFYLTLLEHVTGVQRQSGAITEAGFDRLAGAFEGDTKILVTDDPAPIDKDATSVDPQGGTVVAMPAQRAKELERPLLRVFQGRSLGSNVAIEVFRKAGFMSDGTLFSYHQMPWELETGDLAALEVQIGLRVRSRDQPRAFAEM